MRILLKEGVHPVAQNPWPPQRRANRYHLAVDKVRFAGEPVVAILVKDKNSLEDLIDLVEVEYELLPVVTTIEESKQNKTLLYDDWKDNISQTNEEKKGDAAKAISLAAFVVSAREGIRRQEAAPIETHAAFVSYDREKDLYEVNAGVQSVHGLQDQLASDSGSQRKNFMLKSWTLEEDLEPREVRLILGLCSRACLQKRPDFQSNGLAAGPKSSRSCCRKR